MKFAVYSKGNGKVLRSCDAPEHLIGRQYDPATENIVLGDHSCHGTLVRDGVVESFPEQETMLDPSCLTLTCLPPSSVIYIDNDKYECFDTSCDLCFDQPGKYRVRITAPLYKDKEFTIEINP